MLVGLHSIVRRRHRMAKWILSAESYGAFRATKEYIPVPNPYGVTVVTEREAIRVISGCRWATRGHYVYARERETVRFDTLREAQRYAEHLGGN